MNAAMAANAHRILAHLDRCEIERERLSLLRGGESIRHGYIADAFKACNACGGACGTLAAYRDPLGDLVLVASDHGACTGKAARLGYEPCAGAPGMFPLTCGGCRWRRPAYCKNPARKDAGGRGLVAKRDGLAVLACSGRAAA